MEKDSKLGFTLIELIIVIAILSFVAVVGIRSYGNVRDVQAKKMNLANIKRIGHALATYEAIHREAGDAGYFNYFDSLCDVDRSGPNGQQMGTPGKAVKWGADGSAARSGEPGIYDGSWKYLLPVKNKAGAGSDVPPTHEMARNQNFGTTATGLLPKLGVYYLSEGDAQLLRNAGVQAVLYHNPSTAQAGSFCTVTNFEDGVSFGGGPGFRPDMSAYCPGSIQAGAAVAMIAPGTLESTVSSYAKDGTAATEIDAANYRALSPSEQGQYEAYRNRYSFTGSQIYADLGYPVNNSTTDPTTNVTSLADFVDKPPARLIAFGIGRGAACVRNSIGLAEAPCNPYYDKRNYRQYLAVFALTTGGQGVAGTCRFAGVIDCAGNTYRQVEYDVNWTTELN